MEEQGQSRLSGKVLGQSVVIEEDLFKGSVGSSSANIDNLVLIELIVAYPAWPD